MSDALVLYFTIFLIVFHMEYHFIYPVGEDLIEFPFFRNKTCSSEESGAVFSKTPAVKCSCVSSAPSSGSCNVGSPGFVAGPLLLDRETSSLSFSSHVAEKSAVDYLKACE